MTKSLAEILPDPKGSGQVRLWLDAALYTKKLLLGENGNPWTSAPAYLSYFTQGQGLLRPDVATIDIGDMFLAIAKADAELREEMAAKHRPNFALRKMLESEKARALLNEIVEAVIANLNGRVPLVLAMPSPRWWLRIANDIIGRANDELEPDHAEDAAMYMADLVRVVAGHAVGGIVLYEDSDERPLSDDEIDFYRPLLNVARHYRWAVVLDVKSAENLGEEAAEFAAVISSDDLKAHDVCHGLDISQKLWEENVPDLLPNQFYFVRIPQSANPEQVLEKLEGLKQAAS